LGLKQRLLGYNQAKLKQKDISARTNRPVTSTTGDVSTLHEIRLKHKEYETLLNEKYISSLIPSPEPASPNRKTIIMPAQQQTGQSERSVRIRLKSSQKEARAGSKISSVRRQEKSGSSTMRHSCVQSSTPSNFSLSKKQFGK